MFRRMERRLGQVARHKRLVVLLVGLAPLVLRLLALPFLPPPEPRIQDEFSYLLAADTFAHGRLVNPVHPMWVHFESMHILVRPVYASVFPVAQGLVMAAGQILTARPWTGVWFSIGFMCAALCWMLQGWVSPGWALAGGALAAVRFGAFTYWMDSYYGGAVAAGAGALVVGAFPRLVRRRRWQDAALMAGGFAILANTRPFEGLLLSLPIAAALMWTLRGKIAARAVAIPMILILGGTAAAMGYYSSRFSGSPLVLPYTYYRNHFTLAPHFIWQSARPEPVYHHRTLLYFHTGWEMICYNDARLNRRPHGVSDKGMSYWRFFLGPVLSLPFLTIPWLLMRRRMRWLLATAVLFAIGLAVEVWHAPHYAAPVMGLVLLLLIEALRQVRAMAGAWPIRVLLVAAFLTPVIGGDPPAGAGQKRARILHQLEALGGRHLAIVRYPINHDTGDEWVYNRAGIDDAQVVWSREMDPESNRELLNYFHDRRVWLVEPDATPPKLTPYDPSQPPDPPFRFVKLGTEGIRVLRSPEEVRQKVLARAEAYPAPRNFSCDHWNYLFTEATGVEAPQATGCFSPGNRSQPIPFDDWFAWLEKQQ